MKYSFLLNVKSNLDNPDTLVPGENLRIANFPDYQNMVFS